MRELDDQDLEQVAAGVEKVAAVGTAALTLWSLWKNREAR